MAQSWGELGCPADGWDNQLAIEESTGDFADASDPKPARRRAAIDQNCLAHLSYVLPCEHPHRFPRQSVANTYAVVRFLLTFYGTDSRKLAGVSMSLGISHWVGYAWRSRSRVV